MRIRNCIVHSVLTLIFGVQIAVAECPPSAEPTQAIEHLISFVAQSKLTFIRNGESGDSVAASNHIRSKYDYYRNQIRTSEDFILKCASRSILSGKPYIVRLADGTEKEVSVWLTEELSRFRQGGCQG